MSVSAIENHPQREKIVDRIIAGLPLRQICNGLVPDVSPMSVHRYKVNVVMPLLAKASAENRTLLDDLTVTKPCVPLETDANVVQVVQKEIKDAPQVSIFRQRLEKLHARIDRHLEKAETAVRVRYDKDGNEIVVGDDLSVLAPLVNQMHKNLEMHARATGELEPVGGTSVSIQIIQGRGSDLPRISYAATDAIEIDPDEDGIEDIGVIQGNHN